MTRIAAQRRHTLFFLRGLRRTAPVFLDTEVDASRLEEHRAAARAAGVRYSVVSYVLRAVAEVLVERPAGNAAVGGGLVPRLVRCREVRPKLALDRTLDGVRVVLPAVLPDLRGLDLDGVQRAVDRYRDTPVHDLPELRGTLLLHRLPARLGWWAFRAALARPERRAARVGTVSVSSLGHREVDGFHAGGGTPFTVNLGRVRPRPVAVDGRVEVRPVLRVTLCFDHRVVDGAEAADVLTALKRALEDPRGSASVPMPPPDEGAVPLVTAATGEAAR